MYLNESKTSKSAQVSVDWRAEGKNGKGNQNQGGGLQQEAAVSLPDFVPQVVFDGCDQLIKFLSSRITVQDFLHSLQRIFRSVRICLDRVHLSVPVDPQLSINVGVRPPVTRAVPHTETCAQHTFPTFL